MLDAAMRNVTCFSRLTKKDRACFTSQQENAFEKQYLLRYSRGRFPLKFKHADWLHVLWDTTYTVGTLA